MEENKNINVPKSVLNYAQIKANHYSEPVYAVLYKQDTANTTLNLFSVIKESELRIANAQSILFVSEPVYPQNILFKTFDKIFN